MNPQTIALTDSGKLGTIPNRLGLISGDTLIGLQDGQILPSVLGGTLDRRGGYGLLEGRLIVMMFEGVFLLGAIMFGAVWLARGGSFDGLSGGRRESSIEILDRRFADGAISLDEYHERRGVLTGALPRGAVRED